MMVTAAKVRGIVDAARRDVANRVTSVHEAVVRVRRTVERVGHEVEDRANERHQVIVNQHVALLERIGMVEATVERGIGKVLEHETRHLHERKEARRQLSRQLADGVEAAAEALGEDPILPRAEELEHDETEKAKGTIAHARSVVGDLPCCGGQYPGHVEGCEVLERSRAAKERTKAQLSATSRIDPADAVRGAPTLPPRTVTMTGLPGPAPRKIEGPLAAMEGRPSRVCSDEECPVAQGEGAPHGEDCVPVASSSVVEPKLESASVAAKRTGVPRAKLVDAMKAGKIEGAKALPGRSGGWSAPASSIDAFVKS